MKSEHVVSKAKVISCVRDAHLGVIPASALMMMLAVGVGCSPGEAEPALIDQVSLEGPQPDYISARFEFSRSEIWAGRGRSEATWRYSVSPNGNGNSPETRLACDPAIPGLTDFHGTNTNESYRRDEQTRTVTGLAAGTYTCRLSFNYSSWEYGSNYSIERKLVVRPDTGDTGDGGGNSGGDTTDPGTDNGGGNTPATPSFNGGNLDGLVGNVVKGWCGVTEGSQRLSSEVAVFRGSERVGSAFTSVARPDAKTYIEGEYAKAGSDIKLADDLFGFAYTLYTAGTYRFECVGGVTLNEITFSPPTPPTEPPAELEFADAELDRLEGDVQLGWCAVTRGAERVVDEVGVYFGGRLLLSVPLDRSRPEIKARVDRAYRDAGSYGVVDDDRFGFAFSYGAPGLYRFACGDLSLEHEYRGDERPPEEEDLPEASDGHIDRVEGGNRVRGWCAVTRGTERLSDEVVVYLNNRLHGTTTTNEARADVRAWVNEQYQLQGSSVVMTDVSFGFSYIIDQPGSYTFGCGQEPTMVLDTDNLPEWGTPPEFQGGNIDRIEGNVVKGWCAVTRGEDRLSSVVTVRRDGQFHGTTVTNLARTDVVTYIQEDYRQNQNSFAQLDDALFGFDYPVDLAGTYVFNCGGPDLVITYGQ